MKMLLTIFLLSFSITSTSQVAKECRPNVDLGVSLHRIKPVIPDTTPDDKDSIRAIIRCPAGDGSGFQLKALNDDYEVISYRVTLTNTEQDVIEIVNNGSTVQSQAALWIAQRERNSLVYFECIKARHKSGVIRTLKPASIKIEDIK